MGLKPPFSTVKNRKGTADLTSASTMHTAHLPLPFEAALLSLKILFCINLFCNSSRSPGNLPSHTMVSNTDDLPSTFLSNCLKSSFDPSLTSSSSLLLISFVLSASKLAKAPLIFSIPTIMISCRLLAGPLFCFRKSRSHDGPMALFPVDNAYRYLYLSPSL